MNPTFQRIRRRLPTAIKLIVFAVVAYFIWRSIANAWAQIEAQEGFQLAAVNLWWLATAGVLFLVAEIPMAWFWHATMHTLGQEPRLWESLRAYYLGSLGKYVPGKAMVVVLRAGMVRSRRTDATVAALAVFIETLTMMAVGGFLAALLLLGIAIQQGGLWYVLLVAVGLMAATGIPTIPPIFRHLVYLLRVSNAKADIDMLLRRLDLRLMLKGWVANILGWTIMGLSLWAALKSIPGTELGSSPLETLPLLTASIALAVVAGFVSMIPGGVGVREWALNLLMVPQFGSVVAIVSVILLRLAWLLSEVAFSGILYIAGKFSTGVTNSLPDTPLKDAPADRP